MIPLRKSFKIHWQVGAVLGLCFVFVIGLSTFSLAEKTTITALIGPDTTGFDHTVVNLFEKENPNIHVELIEGPHSTDAREEMYIRASEAKESPYDLVWCDIIWIPPLAAKGYLLPLDNYLDINQLYAQHFKATVDGSVWKGKVYRVPAMSDAGLIYYRKDLLAKGGFSPPETFDDLTSTAQKLQDPARGLWGFVFQGAEYEGLDCFYLEWLWGNGGYYYDPKTRKVGIDSPEGIGATKLLVDLIYKYKITPKDVLAFQEEESRHFFQNGKSVFLRNWPYVWILANKPDVPVAGKIGAKPEVHAPGQKPYATQGGWGFAISNFIESEKISAAVKFARYHASYKIQKLSVKIAGRDASMRAIYYDPEVLKWNPHFAWLRDVLEHTRWRPATPIWPELSDIMAKYLHKAMIKELTPEEANKEMAKEARRAVKEYWEE